MAIFLSRSTRTSRRFSDYVGGARFFVNIKNNLEERGKYLFGKTRHGFENSLRFGSSDCSSSSKYDKDKPCKSKTSSTTGNACGSISSPKNSCDNGTTITDESCGKLSTISRKDSCCSSDSRKSTNSSTSSSRPRLDEPCPRDCKLSSTIQCPDFTRQKSHPEPAPSICPSPEEIARKMKFWRMVTLVGALPTALLTLLITQMREAEERTKPRQKYVPYDYMHRITKPFPWGDGKHTFFHNPIKNPIPPDGYEVDDPNEIKQNN